MSQQTIQCVCGHTFESKGWKPCPVCKSHETNLKSVIDMKNTLGFHEMIYDIIKFKRKYNLPLEEIISEIRAEV